MCRILKLHRSGFYAWRDKPLSNRAIEDQRLLVLIKQSYITSGATYGSPWIHRDLRDTGEACSVHRVARIMRENKLKAQIGYKRRYISGGKTASVADNRLNREFNPEAPNQSWVSDITYVRTHEGFLYLATVLDLFSRRVVGWSMDKNMDRHLVIKALMMAVWGRQPKEAVLVHSDQGSQYGSADYLDFMKANNLEPSMSRRGNCHDNAVAESFFQLLKRELIKRRKYLNREKAKEDIFDYIEMFYNSKRKHGYLNNQSPVDYDKTYFMNQENV